MRAGGFTVQQTLTSEAASVLKHSLSLARRRGHAQVTPLHVAATLLASRSSLLRRACLNSQSHHSNTPPPPHHHPLQCRALELCFNVALNRLPTTPGPLLHAQPSLSNALIAALKRAQAHQRRGCIEQQQQQQQPLLAIKVELEQLILSILDDPSVSRVMREAGFSSTAVKNKLEDSSVSSSVFQCYNSSSVGIYSVPCSPPSGENQREVIINPISNTTTSSSFWNTHFLSYSSDQNHPLLFSPHQKKLLPITDSASVVKEDIKLVLEVLLRNKKRRNTVVVGDSVSTTELIVGELMSKLERGDVPQEMKSTHFIKFQLSSIPLRFMKREEVELNLSDLKRKVDSLALGGRGVIIYTGDLKWASVEEESEGGGGGGGGEYSPVDHLVMEIGRLISEHSNSRRIWLMATANYQTYMRCQLKQPLLEIQWSLQAVFVPSGGLGLSLNATSIHDSKIIFSKSPSQHLYQKPSGGKEEQDLLTCCAECNSNYEKEAGLFKSGQQKPSSAQLPYWLQLPANEPLQKDDLIELRRKWNRLCHSLHRGRHNNQSHVNNNTSVFNNQSWIGKSYSYNSAHPYDLNHSSSLFPDSNSISFADHANWSPSSLHKLRRQQSCHIEFNFSNGNHRHQTAEPNLDSLQSSEGKEVKISLALGNSMFSDSGKFIESHSEKASHYGEISKKLLQENIPWQSESIPGIVKALNDSIVAKKDSWILIDGNDSVGKSRLAQVIAEALLGSADFLLCINMKKRDSPCCKLLERALRNQEKLVVLLENVESADPDFMKFLADGFQAGTFGAFGTKERSSSQAVFIMTKEDSTSYDVSKKNLESVIQMKLTTLNLGTNNLDHKRKPEGDLLNRHKNPRTREKEEASLDVVSLENGNFKKDFTRQSSFNTLDLNVRADEEGESDEKPGDFSPVSSDLTRETTQDHQTPFGFLEQIKNRFVLEQDLSTGSQVTELFLSKIKGSFEEVFGKGKMDSFDVDHMLLKAISIGSGAFLNSLFDKWLKDIFQTSLQTLKIGGKEGGIGIRLCFGERALGGSGMEDGFMGTSLPKRIQVSLLD